LTRKEKPYAFLSRTQPLDAVCIQEDREETLSTSDDVGFRDFDLPGDDLPAVDDLEVVRYYTEQAIYEAGQPAGLEALRRLAVLSQRRIPYDFDAGSNTQLRSGTVVAPFRKLLSPSTMNAFLEQVRKMEANGWLSTNPDSVDGLPSLHLNLVSDGKPIVPMCEDATTKQLDDFQLGTQRLLELIQAQIYDVLLPEVNRLLNSTSITVSDVFLRRYGEDICGEVTRSGISAHYDVFSRVTAVIAMDDVASDGRNGLFTTYVSDATLESPAGQTSNHASLRRFFPLESGDGVIHTWDVLHGVDVEPGLDRTSLIVWFAEDDGSSVVSPWLEKHAELETNDVAQFVLASALSSVDESEFSQNDNAGGRLSENELCLRSASQGNTFALSRMGSMFEEGSINDNIELGALQVLERLRPFSRLPKPVRRLEPSDPIVTAVRFWLEGAVRGNPLAQISLGDELMFQASRSGDSDTRLLATVLFALAAQQGVVDASESLSRAIELDVTTQGIETEEEFLSSPVVQTTRAAIL
jgi:hypothetical protein